MALREALSAGEFIVTGELGAPGEPTREPLRSAAAALASSLHAANVTDNHAATAKMSPLACAALLEGSGLEPIMQMTARDRNVLALQSDLLGASALGVRSVMALSGDPLAVGLYGGVATHVRDLDSLGLTKLIGAMNRGLLACGEKLDHPTDFLVVGAANPLVDDPARLALKLAAGVGLFQTNIVYDVERFLEWLEALRAAGVTDRAPLLVGVTPPRSTRMLTFLDENIPGVEVDAGTFARMERLDGMRAEAEGVRIAADVIRAVEGVDGVAGVHIMAPGWEEEAIPRVVAAAGLRTPAAA